MSGFRNWSLSAGTGKIFFARYARVRNYFSALRAHFHLFAARYARFTAISRRFGGALRAIMAAAIGVVVQL